MALKIVNDLNGINHKIRFTSSYKDHNMAAKALASHKLITTEIKPDNWHKVETEYFKCESCGITGYYLQGSGNSVGIVDDALLLDECKG